MLYEKQANGTIDEVAEKLAAAVTEHKFGVLGTHNLKQKMSEKGLDFGPECRVFEICNPHHAKEVLDTNISVANALPCRVAIYQRDGQVIVGTLKPTALISTFDCPELESVARQVEDAIMQMIDTACQ